MPIWALASAMSRSAAAMSGRRSSNSEGTPIGMGGGEVVIGFDRDGKAGRRLADQRGDGVLKLRAGKADIDRLAPARSPEWFAPGRPTTASSMPVSYRARVSSSAFLSASTVAFRILLQLVLPADFEKDLREAGLFDQPFVLQVGRAELCPVLKLAYRVADLAQKVGRPGDVHGQRVDGALLAGEGGDSGGSAGCRPRRKGSPKRRTGCTPARW